MTTFDVLMTAITLIINPVALFFLVKSSMTISKFKERLNRVRDTYEKTLQEKEEEIREYKGYKLKYRVTKMYVDNNDELQKFIEMAEKNEKDLKAIDNFRWRELERRQAIGMQAVHPQAGLGIGQAAQQRTGRGIGQALHPRNEFVDEFYPSSLQQRQSQIGYNTTP